MSKNFVYCIGGTGARVAEVAAHLCAMNLTKPNEEIEFIIVDKDTECGGTAQAKRVIESIGSISDSKNKGLLIGAGKSKSFCKCNLTISRWNFKDAITNTINIGENASFINSVSDARDRAEDSVLMDAFYKKGEQNTDTVKGFYGMPSIGSLLFKAMLDKSGDTHNEWNIANPIQKYFNDVADGYARVFLIGSIFGGTGASIFPNLAAYIRSQFEPNKVFISGCLLLPYFTMAGAPASGRIHPEIFDYKAAVALEQYAKDTKLMRNGDTATKKNSFDSLYICGQDPFHQTGRYSEGGADQVNKMDIVDLAAAMAMTEFFRTDWLDDKGAQVYDGTVHEFRFSAADDVPVVDLSHMTNLATGEPKKNIVAMVSFCAFLLCYPIAHMVINPNDRRNNLLAKTLYHHVDKDDWASTISDAFTATTRQMLDFCDDFLRLAGHLATIGANVDGTISTLEHEYALLNNEFVIKLRRLCDTLKKGLEGGAGTIKVDKLFKEICQFNEIIPGTLIGATPEETMNAMDEMFKRGSYYHNDDSIPDARTRIGDYLHEAYNYCYTKVG